MCFSAPITEEHAWAIVFECVKCLHSMVESKPRKVFIVTNTKQILLHQEGRVHESTFLIPGSTENEDQENPVSSKNNFIFSSKQWKNLNFSFCHGVSNKKNQSTYSLMNTYETAPSLNQNLTLGCLLI